MALNVASAEGMEGAFRGSNLSKWLHSREHNIEQQKMWKCLIVFLQGLLLASRNPAGLVAFGSLLAEPHLPVNATRLSREAALQKMVLEACGTSTLQISLLCKSLKWQKTLPKNATTWQIFPKVQWATLGLVFLFPSSPHKDLILLCLKFQGDYVA